MKIKRKKYDLATGKQISEDRILELPIKPGLKAGSKIKFKDVGDQAEGGTQDMHFIVEEVCLSSTYGRLLTPTETASALQARRR
jgi:DnaJ family protein B protein 4